MLTNSVDFLKTRIIFILKAFEFVESRSFWLIINISRILCYAIEQKKKILYEGINNLEKWR